MARSGKASKRTNKLTQSLPKEDRNDANSNPQRPVAVSVDKRDKPTHIPNITEEIRTRYERKLAELQAARTVKNPERAEKLRRKRANRKAQRQAAKLHQAQAQKEAKANPNNNHVNNVKNKEDTEDGGKLILSKIDGSKRKERAPLPKNPSQALQKLQNHKQKLQQLDPEERDNRRKDEAWARAIQKSKGLTMKDDEKRLQASLKSREKEKKRRTREWRDKQVTLHMRLEGKQKKRQANIKQRIDAKKAKKMKRRR